MTPGPIEIQRATADAAASLAAIAASTFIDTFAADNHPADMAAHVAEAFGEAVQRAELAEAGTVVLLARRAGVVVGYAMLREGAAPSCVPAEGAIEIVRLYAVREAIGTGVGGGLMDACLAHARARGRSRVWLGVWERNARAIAFSARRGFVDVGSHVFQLGGDRQTDRVMSRPVPSAP